MIPDISIAALGILVGILAGLLPGLPAWLAPFLLLPFVHHISAEQIIIFWIISVIGSQFFGSISGIMFGIPGENSTLVYMNSVRSLPFDIKQQLVRLTADAGFIATIVSFVVSVLLIKTILLGIPFLSTTKFTLVVLWWAALIIILMYPKHIVASIVTFMAGVLLTGNSNIALPQWVIQLNSLTYDVSIINLIIGLLLIPSMLIQDSVDSNNADHYDDLQFTSSTVTGTTIGMIAGLLPGPTATLSSALAWKLHSARSLFNKVVSVEAANNSVVVVGAMVFLTLQTPLALDAVTVNEAITRQGWTQDLISLLSIKYCSIIVISTIILWLLARSTIPMYATLCKLLDSKTVTIALSALLIITDFYSAQGSYNLVYYLTWTLIFIVAGIAMRKKSIPAAPLLLGFVLGEPLIWTTYQIIL